MTQFSVDLRDARNNTFEAILGPNAILELRSGAAPANCAAADIGTLIASMSLPADYLGASSGGAVSKIGTWEDPSADAIGTIGHYRWKTSGGACKVQGPVTVTGGGGDIQLVTVDVSAIGQPVTITAFTITAGGA